MKKYIYAQNGADFFNSIADQALVAQDTETASYTPEEFSPQEESDSPELTPLQEEDLYPEDNAPAQDEHEMMLEEMLLGSSFEANINKAVSDQYESIFKEDEDAIYNSKVGYSPSNTSGVDSRVSMALQELQSKFPVRVTSTIRSEAENKKVGGVKNSKHLYGQAGDASFSQEAFDYYNNVLADKYGLERAPNPNHGTGKHIHIETKQHGGNLSKYIYAQDGYLTPVDVKPLQTSFTPLKVQTYANSSIDASRSASNKINFSAEDLAPTTPQGASGTTSDKLGSVLSAIPVVGKYLGAVKSVVDIAAELGKKRRREENSRIQGLTNYNNQQEALALQAKEQQIIENQFNRPEYENYGLSGISNRPFYRT